MGQACSSYDTAGPHGEPGPSPLPSPPSSFVDGMAPDFDPMFDEVCAISIHDLPRARAARTSLCANFHPNSPFSYSSRSSLCLPPAAAALDVRGVNAGATVTAAADGLLGRPVRVPVSEILKRRDVRWAEAADDLFLSPSSRRMVLHSLSQVCLLYTSPSPRDRQKSRMPSSA